MRSMSAGQMPDRKILDRSRAKQHTINQSLVGGNVYLRFLRIYGSRQGEEKASSLTSLRFYSIHKSTLSLLFEWDIGLGPKCYSKEVQMGFIRGGEPVCGGIFGRGERRKTCENCQSSFDSHFLGNQRNCLPEQKTVHKIFLMPTGLIRFFDDLFQHCPRSNYRYGGSM